MFYEMPAASIHAPFGDVAGSSVSPVSVAVAAIGNDLTPILVPT